MTNARPLFLIDQDAPLADFDRAFFDLCDNHGWKLDCKYGEQTARFATDHILHPAHQSAARQHVDSTPGWFRSLPVTPGAVDGLNELAEHAEVWIVTKPLETNPTCRDDKAAWLERHFGEEWLRRLIITPDKSMVYGHVLLDDAPKPEWLDRAWWAPAIFPTPFNVAGGEWSDSQGLSDLFRWTWGDPVDDLLEYASEARANMADALLPL